MMLKVEPWHRRHALQIACQLPEKHDDAMAVLCAAMDLVKDFLAEPTPDQKPAPVIQLVREQP
jgi:hypothetical protein